MFLILDCHRVWLLSSSIWDKILIKRTYLICYIIWFYFLVDGHIVQLFCSYFSGLEKGAEREYLYVTEMEGRTENIFLLWKITQLVDSKAYLLSILSMKIPFFCAYRSCAVPLPVYPVVVVGFEHGSHAMWHCENPSLLSLPAVVGFMFSQ